MKLVLVTRHRSVVIATGEDAADPPAVVVDNSSSADLTIPAPEYEDYDGDDPGECKIGFRA